MGELISQSEIDDLLKDSLGGDLTEAGPGGEDSAESESGSRPKKFKTFASPKKKELRFNFPYRSPIIKREQYILDPDPNTNPPQGKPVVRTLSNYLKYVKIRNQKVA